MSALAQYKYLQMAKIPEIFDILRQTRKASQSATPNTDIRAAQLQRINDRYKYSNQYKTTQVATVIGHSITLTASLPLTAPIFYDSTSNNYYTLTVHGAVGNEYLQIDELSSPATPSNITLLNPDSGLYYTLDVIGYANAETLSISPTNAGTVTSIILTNPDSGFNYSVEVNGAIGSEYVTLVQQ